MEGLGLEKERSGPRILEVVVQGKDQLELRSSIREMKTLKWNGEVQAQPLPRVVDSLCLVGKVAR